MSEKMGTKEKLSIRHLIIRTFYPLWSQIGLAVRLKNRRLNIINNLFQGQLLKSGRILDIGCANGKDFVLLLKNRKDLELYGIDLLDHKIKQDNFVFVHSDAEKIDYPDKYFDFTVSIGVLEHVQPVEKLSRMINEIVRVSKSYCMIVPSSGTVLEPHSAQFFWHLRDSNKKSKYPFSEGLNFYSDEAWKQFEGFAGCKTKRFWYLPPLIQNLVIYKNNS